jgi:hypothetical protein
MLYIALYPEVEELYILWLNVERLSKSTFFFT